MGLIPVTNVSWNPCYRIVPSRFPPVGLFDDVADPADLEAVFYVESLTNPRLREEVGEISLVPVADRISGPGTTPIMAAFTHLNPDGSRFTDGSYGVYYAARTLETAIIETVYHREIFLRYSHEPAMEIQMRVYQSDFNADLHNLRGIDNSMWLDPDNYRPSQELGRQLRADKSLGIVYPSVRDPGGECVAIFRPPVLSPCVQGPHLGYNWDGDRISSVIEKTLIEINL